MVISKCYNSILHVSFAVFEDIVFVNINPINVKTHFQKCKSVGEKRLFFSTKEDAENLSGLSIISKGVALLRTNNKQVSRLLG